MKYKGIVPERKKWVKPLGIFVSAFMLYRELLNGEFIYIPIAIMVFLACFIKKEQIISEKGVDIQHMLFGLVMHNYWSWEEITTLHADHIKIKPNVRLHIGKDVVVRSFAIKHSECQAVIKLAREMNPNIYIEE